MNDYNYETQPGLELKIKKYSFNKKVISVIIPFYNDGEYIEQTINSVLNQTFPCFEIIIVDDGSKDIDSINKLKEIEKLDDRIKVFHKDNEGLAATRDYGASKSSNECKYLFFLDSDDVITSTYLECAYLSMESHPDAAWAYADTIGFGNLNYKWIKGFDSKILKKENFLVATALIRKSAFKNINGYGLKEKSVNEDWNFWLKMLEKEYFPIHMSFFGLWYRRKDNGELVSANANKKRTLEIIKSTIKNIKKDVTPIEYPNFKYNFETLKEVFNDIEIAKTSTKKQNILMFIPWMVTGGADIFNLEFLRRLNKDKYNVIIISNLPSDNPYRQEFENEATVYDLSSFLNPEYWIAFVNYIMLKENITLIFNTNSIFGYSILPYLKNMYPNVPIVDYIHMEEWYYQNGGFARISSAVGSVIDKTLVCNKQTENVLINYFHRNTKEIDTVYIGVDSEKFNPDLYNKEKIIKKYKIKNNNKKIISYICRISGQKRPMLFAEIVKKVLLKRKDILFLVVGDGDMLHMLKSKLKEYHCLDNVIFLGNFKDPREIYAISDITLNCSIKEGLALTSYESLSMNVPVISSDVGGQKELICNKVGIIVPCYQEEKDINNYSYATKEIDSYVDAINSILNNYSIYKENCRNRILKDFTLNHMGKTMNKELDNILDNPNKEKIKNGKKLDEHRSLLLDNVTNYLVINGNDWNYLANNYQSVYYNKKIVINSLKDYLWQFSIYRKLTESKIWSLMKKILKKG